MLYVSYKLHIAKDKFLGLHVVQVDNGKFVSFYPFEKECESMCWVDTILLSHCDVEKRRIYSIAEFLPDEFIADGLWVYGAEETPDGCLVKKLY